MLKISILVLLFAAAIASAVWVVMAPGFDSLLAALGSVTAIIIAWRESANDGAKEDKNEKASRELLFDLQSSMQDMRVLIGTLRDDMEFGLEEIRQAIEADPDTYKKKSPADAFVHLRNISVGTDGNAEPKSVEDARILAALSLLEDIQTGIRLFRLATKLDPDDIASWINLGVVLMKIGEVDEARQALETAFTQSERHQKDQFQAQALTNLGVIASIQGDYARAEQCHKFALTLHDTAADDRGKAANLANLGVLAWHANKFDQAESLFQESLAIEKRIGHDAGIASDYGSLAVLRLTRANMQGARHFLDEAETLLKDAIEIDEGLGNLAEVAHHSGNLAMVWSTRAEDFEKNSAEFRALNKKSKRLIEENLKVVRSVHHREFEANLLSDLGVIQEELGNNKAAKRCWLEAREIYQTLRSASMVQRMSSWIAGLD